MPGFSAAAVEHGAGFVRRAYSRGPVRLSVTLARYGGGPTSDAQWAQLSADYPQAALPAGGRGFYDCQGQGAAERCDLHAQLPGGYHLEIFSSGTATRADLDALVRGLPLDALPR